MWERPDSQDVGLEAAIIQRVRNCSLVKQSCAENDRDSSLSPKLWDVVCEASASITTSVGEHSVVGRRFIVRWARRNRRDYAGMSSDKAGEKPAGRKPKVS